MAHDQEVVGSNPSTVYCMDVSNLLAITLKRKTENKGSQMGQTKKIFKTKQLIQLLHQKKAVKVQKLLTTLLAYNLS